LQAINVTNDCFFCGYFIVSATVRMEYQVQVVVVVVVVVVGGGGAAAAAVTM
jgi:hypothetical protein